MGLFDSFKKKQGVLQLDLRNDILTEEQRQKYVFSCLREGITPDHSMVTDLSLAEIMSVVHATVSCPLWGYPDNAKQTQETNRKFMLSMAADWLKHNDFFVVVDAVGNPVRMTEKDSVFTCVFSSRELAEKAINGNEELSVKQISANKVEFWQVLMRQGVLQVLADNNAESLTVQECLVCAIAMDDDAPETEPLIEQKDSAE
ncbi:MAG: hypothetical protein E7523_11735 [Ruminococcaceae bacterium]|nr:hypothetical protein [Oscillospiraceae bacterium]